jgi:hypothetical protein
MQMRVNPISLSFVVKACICVQQRGDQQSRSEEEHTKDRRYLHFIALPRLSISPRRNHSTSAASEAFERATSSLGVTLLKSCWVHLNWSRKDQIKDNSPVDGARLSMTAIEEFPAEELPAISYETGQA